MVSQESLMIRIVNDMMRSSKKRKQFLNYLKKVLKKNRKS